MKVKMPETAICLAVLAALKEQGWETFQEVDFGHRADIVARKDGKILIVEAKSAPSMALIGQGLHWMAWGNAVAVATTWSRGEFSNICRALGIHIITVGHDWRNEGNLKAELPYEWKYHRAEASCRKRLLKRLHPLLNEFGKAGSQSEYYSAFKHTCRNLKEYISGHPGVTMKEAVKNIAHHYASETSARSSLGKWITEGSIEGIEWRKAPDIKRYLLYPCEPAKQGGTE